MRWIESAIFLSSVKNLFSWIFPAPGWSPYQSLFLRCQLEKGLQVFQNDDGEYFEDSDPQHVQCMARSSNLANLGQS